MFAMPKSMRQGAILGSSVLTLAPSSAGSQFFEEYLVEVFVSMVETKFAFLQVQIEGLRGYPSELCESRFRQAPKALNFVYVIATVHRAADPIKSLGAEIYQRVEALELVSMARRILTVLGGCDGIKRCRRAVRNDLSIDLALSLGQTEHDVTSTGSTLSFVANALLVQTTLVKLDSSLIEAALLFAKSNDPLSQNSEKTIDRRTTHSRERSGLRRVKVEGKTLQYQTRLSFRNV